jgi:O-antigen/teichoic acid export membrane protein
LPTAAQPAEQARWRTAAHWGLALFDQAAVSGSRFLITIIVGRAAGPVGLGRYAVAFYVLVLLGCMQEALLTTPYAICAPRLRRRSRGALFDGIVALHGVLIAVVILLGIAATALVWLIAPAEDTLSMTVALAVAAPLSLSWEFVRRMLLAQLQIAHAAIIDVVAGCLQIAALAALASAGELSGTRALMIVGIGCALPALAYLWRLVPRRRPRHLRLYWQRNWQLGKWIMGSQMMRALSSVIPIWLLAALAGDPAAGVFAACVSIPMISNPFIFAIGNLLMPKAAHALGSGGAAGVLRLVLAATAASAAVLVPLGLALFFAGEWILELVYGARYAGHGPTLAVLGLCPMIWAATSALACGQAALRQTKASFVATICGILVCTVAIAALASSWQVLGAALGLLAGSATMCAIQAWQFAQRCRELT